MNINESANFSCDITQEEKSNHSLTFKLILIGTAGVGKSSITIQATKNYFDDNYITTLGFDFFSLNCKIDNKYIKLQLWDTCGQEIYRTLVSNFYRSSSLAILVYSIEKYYIFYLEVFKINSRDSFSNLDVWLNDLRHFCCPDIKIFLIGNKADLENLREVSYEEGLEYQKSNKLDFFMETSAKSGLNIKNIFIKATRLLYQEYLNYKAIYDSSKFTSMDTKNSTNSFRIKKPEQEHEFKEIENTIPKKSSCPC